MVAERHRGLVAGATAGGGEELEAQKREIRPGWQAGRIRETDGVEVERSTTAAACKCRIPNPLDTDEARARYLGEDLHRLDDVGLAAERHRALAGIVHYDEHRDVLALEWWTMRIERIAAEQRRRRERPTGARAA
jgi:hypothetical protein